MPNRNPGAAARNKQQAAEANARRRQVAQLRLAGYHDAEVIAQQLGVSARTIRRDFVWLDAQYRQEALADTITLKGQQLQRIEEAITGIYSDVRAGRYGAITVFLGLLDRQAKLMGLDAPKLVQIDMEARLRYYAEQYGLDPDATVAEAQHILQEHVRHAAPR